jgi:hypothetical protein
MASSSTKGKRGKAAEDDTGKVSDLSETNEARTAARRFTARDWSYIAEYVIEEYERRKQLRRDREKQWKEIDRQIAMEPNLAFKLTHDGKIDVKKRWMSEMELPLQAQALEVLTADARRMMFPTGGSFFSANAAVTDEYLRTVDFQSIIMGDENEVPSKINQDNANKLVEGFLLHQFRQYDHVQRFDKINAEAFKYGMGVGRGRLETMSVLLHEALGVRREMQRIPTLVPCSIKNHYLDDALPSTHSAHMLSPSHISVDRLKLAALAVAASKGSKEPNDADGGWMPQALGRLKEDDNGYVQLIEMEGDIVVPRKTTRSFVLHGAIVTVALGSAEKKDEAATRAVVRFRWRQTPYSSYVLFPYHFEGSEDTYPTSPLMKGRPVQIMAVDALNRLMDSAALKNAPPVGYDKDDTHFAAQGGPVIEPYAQWGSIDSVNVHSEVGGEPSTMAAVLQQAISFYAELTGVLPARLGAQTVSHTTAFAKDAELQRGAVRTVDYVNSAGQGPITRWLHMAYDMSRRALSNNAQVKFYIPAYGGFVQVSKAQLPEHVLFEWHGAGGPAEEMQKQQKKLAALGLALKMDQLGVATGQPPDVDLSAAKREVLREGGWTDIDVILRTRPAPQQSAAPGVPPGASPADTGAAALVLQNFDQAA